MYGIFVRGVPRRQRRRRKRQWARDLSSFALACIVHTSVPQRWLREGKAGIFSDRKKLELIWEGVIVRRDDDDCSEEVGRNNNADFLRGEQGLGVIAL